MANLENSVHWFLAFGEQLSSELLEGDSWKRKTLNGNMDKQKERIRVEGRLEACVGSLIRTEGSM